VKFLLDAQLPPALCEWLRARGHEASDVWELELVSATDAEIADRAEADRAVLVTTDEAFLTLRLPDRFALLWLRCETLGTEALTAWLEPRWPQIEDLLAARECLVEVR